jgi:hypothetical protein
LAISSAACSIAGRTRESKSLSRNPRKVMRLKLGRDFAGTLVPAQWLLDSSS